MEVKLGFGGIYHWYPIKIVSLKIFKLFRMFAVIRFEHIARCLLIFMATGLSCLAHGRANSITVDQDVLQALSGNSDRKLIKLEIAPVEKLIDEDCSTFAEQYRQFYIRGSLRSPDGWSYIVSDGQQSFTNDKLQKQGIVISGVSSCKVELSFSGCSLYLRCPKPAK